MDNNNLNQNNLMENQTTTPSVEQLNSGYASFPTTNQTNEVVNSTENTTPKKKNPIIIFGIFLAVAIILVVTLFFENNGGSFNSSNLIKEDTKTLIVYFSHDGENYGKNLNIENKKVLTVGNTEIMAKRIADFIDADLYEIEPAVAYPTDLDELYTATKVEYNKNVYPNIKEEIDNLDDYDVVFIGYPIWHASYPQIIKTFVRDNKSVLQNKIIVPFNTHAGSGSAGTYKKLFSLIGCSDNKGLNGLAINGTEVESSDKTIRNWLKGIGYKIK